jgi:inhibitor of KinA
MAPPASVFPRIEWVGDRALLVRAGKGISRECQADVSRLFLLLASQLADRVQSIHPAYDSVLVTFDAAVTGPEEMTELVRALIGGKEMVALPEPRTVEIPVCYEREMAPDLGDIAALNGISVEDVVRLHTGVDYLVYFLGFSPGFPYLGELPDALATPRLKTPRLRVPAGSVAIGGSQTGIYPVDSPGGWRLIGRTPIPLFSPEKDPPTLLQMGDRVRFIPITLKEFEARRSSA